jgi:hypothetical protein
MSYLRSQSLQSRLAEVKSHLPNQEQRLAVLTTRSTSYRRPSAGYSQGSIFHRHHRTRTPWLTPCDQPYRSFAQTASPSTRSARSSSPPVHFSRQHAEGPYKLSGVWCVLQRPSCPSNTCPSSSFSSSILQLRSSFAAMASLSQPQTPATLDSPLREHRHRPVERLTDRLETPSLDDRSYRVIKLPNQLEVLLVHDADTDKASAAMDVNVGNFSDDDDAPGLAHAVEHLLFMGTKKVWKSHVWSADFLHVFSATFQSTSPSCSLTMQSGAAISVSRRYLLSRGSQNLQSASSGTLKCTLYVLRKRLWA